MERDQNNGIVNSFILQILLFQQNGLPFTKALLHIVFNDSLEELEPKSNRDIIPYDMNTKKYMKIRQS